MAECPVCGLDVAPEVRACPGCGLPVGMFDAVREVSRPDSDRQYADTVAEAFRSISGGTEPAKELRQRPPLAPADSSEPVVVPTGPGANGHRDDSEGPATELERQVSELSELSIRLGLKSIPLEATASSEPDASTALRVRRKALFSAISAELVERYARISQGRDELAARLPTLAVDAELRKCRAALAGADLVEAERSLRRAEQEIPRVEQQWNVLETLFTEVYQLGRLVRARGGDPKGALAPVAQVFQGASPRMDLAQTERVLRSAKKVLWDLLGPANAVGA
jgi:hypothetical protein